MERTVNSANFLSRDDVDCTAIDEFWAAVTPQAIMMSAERRAAFAIELDAMSAEETVSVWADVGEVKAGPSEKMKALCRKYGLMQ